MSQVRNLLCAALIAVTLAPQPAYADIIIPDEDDVVQTNDENGQSFEKEAQTGNPGCSNAAAAAYASPETKNGTGLAAAVGCLSVAAAAGVICIADRRSE